MSLGIILLGLLWYAGLPLRVFLRSLVAVVVSAAVLAVSEGYRSDRVQSWLNPGADAQGSGYQARQARFALANGGVFGDGLGQGTAKWNYLPNAHNDFIFAIIGEELGFVGAVGLLCLFGLFAYTGMRIARRSADPFLRLLTATATLWVLGQVFINVGYVVGLLPVTGLQLPLISAGGTSTATTLLMIGIMANAARHEPEAVAALRAGRDDRVNRLLRLPLPEPYVPTRTEALRDRLRYARTDKPPQPEAEAAQAATKQARPRNTGRRAGIRPTRPVRPRRASMARSRRPAKAGPTGSHTGRSALRVNDALSVPRGQEQGSQRPGDICGPRRRWHRWARRTRDGCGRRAERARPRRADHRAGHRAWPGDPARPRTRLSPRADHPGAAAPQAHRATWSGCRCGCGARSGRPVRCSTTSTPTS